MRKRSLRLIGGKGGQQTWNRQTNEEYMTVGLNKKDALG